MAAYIRFMEAFADLGVDFSCKPQRKRGRPSARSLTFFLKYFFPLMNCSMLQVQLPPGSLLGDFTYNSAEPAMVCKVLSPSVLQRTVVSKSAKAKAKALGIPIWKVYIMNCLVHA